MENKTAVEWLYQKLATSTSEEMVGNINNWFNQALQMEKEQSKQKQNDAYKKGFNDGIKYERIRL